MQSAPTGKTKRLHGLKQWTSLVFVVHVVVTAEILANSVLGIVVTNTSPYSFVENIVASRCFVYKSLQQVLLAFLVISIGLVL